MATNYNQATQNAYQAESWAKRGRYIMVELCACAMRHCINSKFMVREPLENLYPAAQLLGEGLGQWLQGYEVKREKLNQPLLKLLQAGATHQDLNEMVEQLQLFFEESLENGFNAPPAPVRQVIKTRFGAYLQALRTSLLSLQTPGNPLAPTSEELRPGPTNFSLRFFGS